MKVSFDLDPVTIGLPKRARSPSGCDLDCKDKLFHSLADPARLRILDTLCEGAKPVEQIAAATGGVVLRKHGPFRALIWGHFAAALGALILACFGRGFTPAALALPLIVIGSGVGIATPAMNLAVLDSVERTQGGLASEILNSARQTGGVIGVAVLGALLGEPATRVGAQAAQYVAAGVFFLAGGLALAASKDWHLTPPAASTVSNRECDRRMLVRKNSSLTNNQNEK
jgi:MFS family permease